MGSKFDGQVVSSLAMALEKLLLINTAPKNNALRRSAPIKLELEMWVHRRSELLRFVPLKFEQLSTAPAKTVDEILDNEKLAQVKSVSDKYEPDKSERTKSQCERSEPAKFLPAKVNLICCREMLSSTNTNLLKRTR